jgi:hypothetical protein
MNGSDAAMEEQAKELTKPLTRERMGQMLAEVGKQNHWPLVQMVLWSDGSGKIECRPEGVDNGGGYFNSDDEFMELCAELIVKGKQD